MSKHQEIRFEEAIENALVVGGDYTAGKPDEYDAEAGFFPKDILDFISCTQAERWQSLVDLHGTKAEQTLLSSLAKELDTKNVLHVLRYGFKCFGKTFKLAYFAPNTGMNPEAEELFKKNNLKIFRQVHFSIKNPDQSVDVVLAVNGLPLVTMELKNPMTGQTVHHAIKQYKTSRDQRETLFAFKKRSLVHFAVDPDEVFMATNIDGDNTYFLPFNKGNNRGAGNPQADNGGYRVSYLWDEVLSRRSLLDILGRFMHLQVEEKMVPTPKGIKRTKKETMIFPRYHQLDAVRSLVGNAREKGAGHNYLIQHSAGSGKSNSIAWLAYRLSSLHDEHDNKVFHSVIVITDRTVLDQQLQNTIYQFEHKQGVVQKIDKDTQQLARAISSGVPIVISTIQKFPFISQAISTMEKKGETVNLDTAGKRYAVIVDEAHSSQSGETATELRKVLNKSGIESAIASEFLDEEGELSEEAKKELMREMMKRPRQPNLSFFAFTATPKYKTQMFFNEPNPKTNGLPFHEYTMRQAIEEGFILDVLKNYTTYKTFYGLVKSIEDDPQVPKKKAAKALARFMRLHPHNIGQKVEVIVEHFRTSTRHKIGGKAKAMVVTESRLSAVRYKQAFDAYITKMGYGDIKSLVAFSGTVNDPDIPDSAFTEVSMNNGVKEKELPEKFSTDEYQVLLVAEKYQTGFDQPLLHTMYVDKRLSGIQAVQTLSRLNRRAGGKDDTFVLDFVNEREEIYASFKPYYEATPPGEVVDPHRLYELQHKVMEWPIVDDGEVTQFCEIWFSNREEPTPGDHQRMNALLGLAVDRFKELGEEEKEAFEGHLKSFNSLYGFLAQIIPYQDSGLEKLYTFGRFLAKVLPCDEDDVQLRIQDDVELKYYRLEKISEGSIDLGVGDAESLKGPSDVGTRKAEDEEVELSSLVDRLNGRFGTNFTEEDQLFFDQIEQEAIKKERLRDAAQVNNLENFAFVFNRMLEGLFVERMEGNERIFAKLMNDENFREEASHHLVQKVYSRLRGSED